jgi:adenine deaminase
MDLKRLIMVARGDLEADLVFLNARIVNTFTGEIEEGNVAVAEGRVAGVGDYREGRRVVDLRGRYLAPGLVDGHVHLESSMLDVGQYARAVVPHGTLAAVADPHEMANVTGLRGVRYLIERSRRAPMDLFFMAPSCVPATSLETSGASLGPSEVRRALRWKKVIGLGEVMAYPEVIGAEGPMLDKIRAARGRVRDGHAPQVRGRRLNAYLCPLLASDHESTSFAEGQEKLRRGMHLMIREGTTEKNLEALLPLVTDGNYHRCMLVVDDRDAVDLYYDGDVDAVVRKAISLGLDPVRAVQMASLNPARYFGLEGLGGIGPGYFANLLVLDDLRQFKLSEVYFRGRLVAAGGKACFSTRQIEIPWVNRTFRVKPYGPERLGYMDGAAATCPVIEVVTGQIVTRWSKAVPRRVNGLIQADPSRDLLKLAVIERHKATGNIGVALVKGFGLKHGAIGTSVAHDSHNIVAVGASDEDIYAVAKEIEVNQGGLACAAGGRITASLKLPIAGLLSPEPLETVVSRIEELGRAARELGCTLQSPFSALSFMALAVVPDLKLTDQGLVDVAAGRLLAAEC